MSAHLDPAAAWRSYPYGPDAAQVAELALPTSGAARGSVLLIHGGYWRARYDRSLQHDVAADLVAAGWAVWNLDYRAVGALGSGPTGGGGWPTTFQDVAAGIDAFELVAAEHLLDVGALIAIGHSAGGALALWAAGRHRLPAGAPGAGPRVSPSAVIAQAAICDLVAGARQQLGAGAIVDLMGGDPDAVPDRYAIASPSALLPLGVPMLLVAGALDDTVPVGQSVAFAAAAARAGDDVTLEIVPGEGHFGHLDPDSDSWSPARAWLDTVEHTDRPDGVRERLRRPAALEGCPRDLP